VLIIETEAVARILWRTPFGRFYGTVVIQTVMMMKMMMMMMMMIDENNNSNDDDGDIHRNQILK
jgi:uncharacterized membrane protein